MGIENQNMPKLEIQNNLTINTEKSNYYENHKIIAFKSIDDILYLIYETHSYETVIYNLSTNQIMSRIDIDYGKKDIRHIFDDCNKRDLLLVVVECYIYIFNIRNIKCINKFKIEYNERPLGSFIKDNNQINVVVSNNSNNLIDIFNLNGIKEKSLIKEGKGDIINLEAYYDKNLKKSYIIISGNFVIYYKKDYVISIDYDKNQIYHKYNTDDEVTNIIISDIQDEIKMICSIYNYILIFGFHSSKMIKKIFFNGAYGICLWSNDFLIAGNTNIFIDRSHNSHPLQNDDFTIKGKIHQIYLIDLKSNKIKKINEDIEGDEKNKALIGKKVLSIIKINHPKYKNCLVCQDFQNIINMIIINEKC